MKKIGILDFFKPDLRRVAIFVILAAILFNIEWWWIPKCCDFIYYQGLPLSVYYWGGFAGFPKTCMPVNLVVDMLIWYLISCIIVWIYDKFRKK